MSLTEPFSHAPLAPERGAVWKLDRKPNDVEDSAAAELADMRELQAISTRLIQEDGKGLYDAILDAALRLLRSDMATMQLYEPGRDGLKMLTTRGFDPVVLELFDWVPRDAGTSCAMALRSGTRTIIPDIDTCSEILSIPPAHEALRSCGIRAAQSTPLVSRSGALIGMITNHWREPHTPTERQLLLVDVLARQAADLIDRGRNDEKIVVLAREAEHRSKNMLAAVQAVVRLTKADTAADLKAAIVGRINALDNVHRLFVQSNWAGADLRSLIADELSPYRKPEDRKAELSGPDVVLEPNAAQAVSMALHELATNAAKYGALSSPNGRVSVRWSQENGGIVFRWEEKGGPSVTVPTKTGVGTKVMDGMIRGQLKGTMDFDWRAEGLVCTFSLPV